MAKNNGPASEYAKPHTMSGKPVSVLDAGFEVTMPIRENWTPLNGGVSIGHDNEVKTTGIETRGNGAATKGRIARGPMA
jgi:hypothetical protein